MLKHDLYTIFAYFNKIQTLKKLSEMAKNVLKLTYDQSIYNQNETRIKDSRKVKRRLKPSVLYLPRRILQTRLVKKLQTSFLRQLS